MDVAIIHYWLNGMRGGEKVLEAISDLYTSADLYTHVLDEDQISDRLKSHEIKTSFIDDLPLSKQLYQYYLPLMPMALEQLDLSDYDLVISSESGPAKGVITDPSAFHICYCHSPMRYLWDMKREYFDTAGFLKNLVMKPLLHYLRIWDQLSSNRVDQFIANSSFVARRIKKTYRRDATVINPPVDVERFSSLAPDDSFLFVGELVNYKRADLVIKAFNELDYPLKVVGKGEEKAKLKDMADVNIEFLGFVDDRKLQDIYSSARALIHPGKEDFGIVPVEAMASGCPVIAYGEGGALDTVKEGETGLFFEEQRVDGLKKAVQRFLQNEENFDRQQIAEKMEYFREERFKKEFTELVETKLNEFF